MANQGRRDRAIDHLLRHGGAAPRPSAAADNCVDGETLAAWSSGALAAAEAARVEGHLADCARCQSMLAAFVRTEPIAGAPARWWTRAHLRWLVPLATAATVAAIWVAIPSRNEPPLEPQLGGPAAVEPSARPNPRAATQPAPGAAAELRAVPDPRASRGTTETDRSGQSRSSRAGDDVQRKQKRFAAPPVPQEADAIGQQRKETSNEARAEGRIPGAPARERAATEPAAAAPPTDPPTPQALQETIAKESVAMRRDTAALGTLIVSPDGTVRWRILDGKVERSTTQGRTWDPMTLPTAATITAGHAPSALVVWLVGKAGAIFVASNGADLQQVPFVSSADVLSVVAVDDRQATVTTAEGRQFRTANRGLSWTPL